MTGINSPFSQFNNPRVTVYNQNNNAAQNNNATEEQTKFSKKKQFDSKVLLIPAGTTFVGGVGGFAAAKFQEPGKFETLEKNALKLEKELTEQFNKSDNIIHLNKSIKEIKETITNAENSLSDCQKKLLKTEKQSQIDIINDLIQSTNERKESNIALLNQYNAQIKSFQEQYIKIPLDSFKKNETAKIKNYKNKIAAIYTAIGLGIGIAIVLISQYLKKDDK